MDPTPPPAPPPTATPPAELNNQVMPADCGCGGKGTPPQLVFALGKLSFDYGLRARRDYFFQDMSRQLDEDYKPEDRPVSLPPRPPNIDDPLTLVWYLSRTEKIGEKVYLPNREKITSIIWTLKLDDTPIYALKPIDAHAAGIYDILVGILREQVTPLVPPERDVPPVPRVERVSVPGIIAGQVRLFTGETVPVIAPDVRGIYAWNLSVLIETIKKLLKDVAPTALAEHLHGFFDRVYYELRNLGLTPQERALNYAATDALRVARVFHAVLGEPKAGEPNLKGYELDTIAVERSPLCRPDSDCWDVKLIFYNPKNNLESRYVFRFTIDVSDVVPVMIGDVRKWSMR